MLGNEHTGDRPWRGFIEQFYIADRAITAREVKSVAGATNPYSIFGDSLVAWYRFKHLSRYVDQAGHLPELFWRGMGPKIEKKEGVRVGADQWLELANSTSELTRRLVATSQFTLGITFATADTVQEQTARIVSVSADPDRRNFTLGQLGSDLVVRLRTPFTGENGVDPQLIVPNFFSDTLLQELIITYNGARLSLYARGKELRPVLELSPGGIAFSPLLKRTPLNLKLGAIVYYAFVFVPIGILISLIHENGRRLSILQLAIATIPWIMLVSLILEGLLVGISGRAVEWKNLFFSFVFAWFGAFSFGVVHDRRVSCHLSANPIVNGP
jgi:hypothetical protein